MSQIINNELLMEAIKEAGIKAAKKVKFTKGRYIATNPFPPLTDKWQAWEDSFSEEVERE